MSLGRKFSSACQSLLLQCASARQRDRQTERQNDTVGKGEQGSGLTTCAVPCHCVPTLRPPLGHPPVPHPCHSRSSAVPVAWPLLTALLSPWHSQLSCATGTPLPPGQLPTPFTCYTGLIGLKEIAGSLIMKPIEWHISA